MKNIEWYNGPGQNLRQAISSGIEFAFASPDNKQVSPFAYCKDYLQDAVQGFLYQKKKTIYGFTYDPVLHHPICLKKTRLLVTNEKDHQFSSKVPNCIDFLNQIEKDLLITKTVAHRCKNPPNKYIRPGIWLFDGSRRWLKSPPMLSMYTLLIRLGFGHPLGSSARETLDKIAAGELKAYQTVDSLRLREAKVGIDFILKKGDRKIFDRNIENNYPKTMRVNTMHNSLGIIGFANERTKKLVPSWHKEKFG